MDDFNGKSDGQGALDRVVVVQQDGPHWRAVVLERAAASVSGAQRSESAAVRASRGGLTMTDLSALVSEHQVERVVGLLPPGRVVSRTFTMPAMDASTLVDAIDLQTEASLSRGLESHRRAGAALPWSIDAAAAEFAVVAMGWPGVGDPGAGALQAGLSKLTGRPDVRFAGISAALIELLWRTGSTGAQNTGSAAAVDAEAGVVDVVATRTGRTIFRTLRISGAERASAISRSLTEIEVSLGAPAGALDGLRDGITSRISRSASGWVLDGIGDVPRVRGLGQAPTDPQWWSEFGLATLAGLGALSGNGSSRRRLYELQDVPPIADTPSWLRILDWLGAPGRAGVVAAIAVVAILMFPLAVQGVRLGVLSFKARGLSDALKHADELESRTAVYALMKQQRWPMPKLIADVCGASPANIQITELRLIHGEEVRIRGTYQELDAKYAFVSNLNATGVFEAELGPTTARDTGEDSGGGYLFDIRAKIVAPFAPTTPAVDYAAQSLSERLYGDSEEGGDVTAANRPNLRTRPQFGRTNTAAAQSTLSLSGPLSEAQIKSLDVDGIASALEARGVQHYQIEGLDDATRQRIESEWSALKAQLAYLRKGGAPVPLPVEKSAPRPTAEERQPADADAQEETLQLDGGEDFFFEDSSGGDGGAGFDFGDPNQPTEDPRGGGDQ